MHECDKKMSVLPFILLFCLIKMFCCFLSFTLHNSHYLWIKEEASISQGLKGCWSFERLTKTYKYLNKDIDCEKLTIWCFGRLYVCLLVCLFVCLFVSLSVEFKVVNTEG